MCWSSEGIKGEITLTKNYILYHFPETVNFTDYPAINQVWLTIKNPSNGEMDHMNLLHRNGHNSPWEIMVNSKGESHANVLKRLLLTIDRAHQSTPEEIRNAYDAALETPNASTTLPYREPVDVDFNDWND